jgi:hypothetical protein
MCRTYESSRRRNASFPLRVSSLAEHGNQTKPTNCFANFGMFCEIKNLAKFRFVCFVSSNVQYPYDFVSALKKSSSFILFRFKITVVKLHIPVLHIKSYSSLEKLDVHLLDTGTA